MNSITHIETYENTIEEEPSPVHHANTYSIAVLENIKNKIENMSKSHHIEILRILKNNASIKINENKNGIFVNLSFLPKNTMDEIFKYVQYIDMQENSIMSLETMKEGYKNTYFVEKENKDNILSYNNLCSK